MFVLSLGLKMNVLEVSDGCIYLRHHLFIYM